MSVQEYKEKHYNAHLCRTGRHKWEKIKRPYQYQIDRVEGVSFLDSKRWIICKRCMKVEGRKLQLGRIVPKSFIMAGY